MCMFICRGRNSLARLSARDSVKKFCRSHVSCCTAMTLACKKHRASIAKCVCVDVSANG